MKIVFVFKHYAPKYGVCFDNKFSKCRPLHLIHFIRRFLTDRLMLNSNCPFRSESMYAQISAKIRVRYSLFPYKQTTSCIPTHKNRGFNLVKTADSRYLFKDLERCYLGNLTDLEKCAIVHEQHVSF